MINAGYFHRREGRCPLQYALSREVLEYIHDDFRFTITRYGLGDSNEAMPAKLSIRAILNARLMDCFKDVLLGQSLREKVWPIVKSCAKYNDIVPWLRLNRCPYVYDTETVKTANEYGIYRWVGGVHDGHVYEGNWKTGKMHGQGKYTFPNGSIYEGSYKDNKRYGQGKNTWSTGSVYEGGWKNDQRYGQGKQTRSNGDVYEGSWKNNIKEGSGTMTYHDGIVFVGIWKGNNRCDHQGKQTWPDGRVYDGEWKGQLRHGHGKQTWPDGRVYFGDWEDDKIHGYGQLTHPDGTIQDGDFINNNFQTLVSDV